LDETTSIFAPKFTLDSEVLVHTHSPPHQAKIVGLPLYDRPDIYTVLFQDGSLAECSDSHNILEAVSSSAVTSPITLLPSWIQGGSKRHFVLRKHV
jgi:hypothetical protein